MLAREPPRVVHGVPHPRDLSAAVHRAFAAAQWVKPFPGSADISSLMSLREKIRRNAASLVVAGATIFANADRSLVLLATIVAAVGCAVGVYNLSQVASLIGQADGLAQTGWELYAVVVGGGVAAVALVSARQSLGHRA